MTGFGSLDSGAEDALFRGICDDAAIFPPGNLPLAEAIVEHLRHQRSSHAALVGPLVVSARDLDDVSDAVTQMRDRPRRGELALTVTTPLDGAVEAVARAQRIAAVNLVVLEVAMAEDALPSEVVPSLDKVTAEARGVSVYVEIPRDERRHDVIAALTGTGYFAKFRTGGVRADLYPDESELAGSLLSATRAGVAFKATAGLHHALRNTDPSTGFEQHGFLNLLTATASALAGGGEEEISDLLAERDGTRVTQTVLKVDPAVRNTFHSFGTCSIAEPIEELVGLGLLDHSMMRDIP